MFLVKASAESTINLWWAECPLKNDFSQCVSPGSTSKNSILLQSPQNYRINAALMVKNNGKQAVVLRPELYAPELQNNIIMRESVFIRSRAGILFADILPKISKGGAICVSAGETQQIFLEINTDGLASGSYKASLNLWDVNNKKVSSATLQLMVSKLKLSSQNMDLLVWDCSLRQLQGKNAEKLAKFLGESGVDIFHVLEKIKIKFNKEGNIVGEPDFTLLDRTLDIVRPYAEMVLLRGCCIFCPGPSKIFPEQRNKKDQSLAASDYSIQYGTLAWKNAVHNYTKALRSHLAKRGWEKSEWALYPYDEYIGVYFSDFAREVKKVDPEIRIFGNSVRAGSPELLVEKLKNEIDIYDPPYAHFGEKKYKQLFKTTKKYLKKRWSYFCHIQQLRSSPTTKYRLMGWNTFVWENDGAGYWSATGFDGKRWGGDPWDDTDGKSSNETTLYISDGKIIESRRWIGVKTGLRDNALFLKAQDLAEKDSKKTALLLLLNTDIPNMVAQPKEEKMQDIIHKIVYLTEQGE